MKLKNLYNSVTEVEQFLRDAADQEGLSWHEFADKYGIVDEALERQIRRKEVPLG